jgi:hypothetical protein
MTGKLRLPTGLEIHAGRRAFRLKKTVSCGVGTPRQPKKSSGYG